MSKKYFLLFLFTGLSFGIFAQNAQIKGKVIAENYPIEGATVQVQKSNNGVVTDVNGNFTIKNLEAGTYTLEVNFIGFERYTQRVTLKANQLLELTIELKSDLMLLEEVVIVDAQSGLNTRTPYSVSKIDAKGIEFKGNPSGVMGIITQDPAVYGAEMGQGIVKPFIRGLGFSRVVTIFQSNKIENHQWGADHGLGLNDLGVASVDIIKGPASILYGSGAIGGVLLIKDDESYLNGSKWTGNFGSTFNSASLGGRFNGSLGKKFDNGIFVAVDAAHESHADYVDGNNRIIGNSRFNTTNFRAHTGIKKDNFSNKLSYTYLEQNLGIISDDEMDDELSLATTRSDRSKQLPLQNVVDHIISYRQQTQHNDWETAVSLSYHMNTRKEIEEAFDAVDLGLHQTHLFYNARVSHQTTSRLSNTIGVQGSFIENRNLVSAGEILLPDSRTKDVGLYWMSGIDWKDFFFQLGARYDNRTVTALADRDQLVDYGFILPGNPANRRLNVDFSGWTGSLGVSRKIDNHHTIKLNLATGFRAPDLAELFSNGPHPGTNRFEVGNANFNREQSFQADVNWIFTSSKFKASLAFFGNLIDQYIFFTDSGETNADGLEIWEFQQTDARLYGTEFQFSYDVFENQRLVLQATANKVVGEDRVNRGYLTFVPANNYMLRADYKPFEGKNWNTFVIWRYVDRQNRPGINEQITPMYALLNAGITNDFKLGANTLAVGLTASNLLNRVYVDHMSILRAFGVHQVGRNIMLNAQYRF